MSDLLQRARDIAADTYIRLEMKNPTGLRTLHEWARHIETYSQFMRDGGYDQHHEVQAAIIALRSVAA